MVCLGIQIDQTVVLFSGAADMVFPIMESTSSKKSKVLLNLCNSVNEYSLSVVLGFLSMISMKTCSASSYSSTDPL